jgi:hypothetical protein
VLDKYSRLFGEFIMKLNEMIGEKKLSWPEFVQNLARDAKQGGWNFNRRGDYTYMMSKAVTPDVLVYCVVELDQRQGNVRYGIGSSEVDGSNMTVDDNAATYLDDRGFNTIKQKAENYATALSHSYQHQDSEEDHLADLAADWYYNGNDAELKKLGWEPEYGDDYNVVILYNPKTRETIGFTEDQLGIEDADE